MNYDTANSLNVGEKIVHAPTRAVVVVAAKVAGSMISVQDGNMYRHYDMHAMGAFEKAGEVVGPRTRPLKDDLAGVPDALLRQQVLAAMTSDLTSIYDLVDKFPHGTPHQRIFRLALELVDSGEVERIEDRRGPCYRLKPAEHVAPADPQPPTPKEAPMAKGKSADPDQLELIEVDGPEFKSLRKELQEYDTLRASNAEEISALNNEERAKRKKVLDKAKAAGLKPDEEGGYNLEFGGNRWRISQDAQLRIKKSRAPRREADDDEPEEKSEGKDAKAPELQRDGRR